jgi:hypothetical protein
VTVALRTGVLGAGMIVTVGDGAGFVVLGDVAVVVGDEVGGVGDVLAGVVVTRPPEPVVVDEHPVIARRAATRPSRRRRAGMAQIMPDC